LIFRRRRDAATVGDVAQLTKATLAEQACKTLRRRIVGGEFAFGQRSRKRPATP